jgi:hypothetical protein
MCEVLLVRRRVVTDRKKRRLTICIVRCVGGEAIFEEVDQKRVKTAAPAILEIFLYGFSRQLRDKRPCRVTCTKKGLPSASSKKRSPERALVGKAIVRSAASTGTARPI